MLKMTEALTYWYSSDSPNGVLSNQYQHKRGKIALRYFVILHLISMIVRMRMSAYGNVIFCLLFPFKYNFLEPKYGNCGIRHLDYFSQYGQGSCVLECLSKNIQKKCGCRPIYMPPWPGSKGAVGK